MLSNKANPVSTPAASGDETDFVIRSFRSADWSDVLHLYYKGLLAGHLNQNDPASDLADIEASYFTSPQDHFWVAQARDAVIGTVAISQDEARVTHLRRLRVAPFWQLDNRVATGLIRTAINHARFHGCLKLVFHTSLDGQTAVELLHGLGLQLSRIRDVAGQHLIEFYDNLYGTPAFGSYGCTHPPGE